AEAAAVDVDVRAPALAARAGHELVAAPRTLGRAHELHAALQRLLHRRVADGTHRGFDADECERERERRERYLRRRTLHPFGRGAEACTAAAGGSRFGGSGSRGSLSSRMAAKYTNAASIVAACFASRACTRSYVSMFVWCV